MENTVLTVSVTGGLGKGAASTGLGASRCPWQLAKGFSLTASSLQEMKLIFNLPEKFARLEQWMGPISWASLRAEWGPYEGFHDNSL